ncbi:hypothetical protein EPA93_45695 [Ktedonosporobacter rubrisoli]|uniref:Uncharacterized protein n=1 Tax=Ktedonosporobacter rubrisoli TaxID=2509675 RepID=A0A4P6K4L6_KTERU|nr:FDLD family class I lanthipeptide [Ktedonosporobacter rubrisoli]QBD82873.1 hypothetical protein EPA93_45695 [Ktedonosporobacter rubrisoli]
MESTLVKGGQVKEVPAEIKERNAAIVESEFDLDIQVFTPAAVKDGKTPQAIATVWSCSCATCHGGSCWTCSCWPNC